jgi:hypothetical protein
MKLLSLLKFIGCHPVQVVPIDESIMATCYSRSVKKPTVTATAYTKIQSPSNLHIFIKSQQSRAQQTATILKRIKKHDLVAKSRRNLNGSIIYNHRSNNGLNTSIMSKTLNSKRRVRFDLNDETTASSLSTNQQRSVPLFDSSLRPAAITRRHQLVSNEHHRVPHSQLNTSSRLASLNNNRHQQQQTRAGINNNQPTRVRRQNVYVKQPEVRKSSSIVIVNIYLWNFVLTL